MVSFASDTKLEDGELAPGKNPMWLSASKVVRVRELLAVIRSCCEAINLPDRHSARFTEHLGLGKVAPAAHSPRDRVTLDACIQELVAAGLLSIPFALRPVLLAVRHALPFKAVEVPLGCVRVVCLFPVAACATPKVHSKKYQFDGGWRSDGLFLWLGQRQRRGHVEVQQALEDPYGPSQAVLLFTRSQQDSKHTYVGRVRGYLPVAEQDPATSSPFRAALSMDTSETFELTLDGDHSLSLAPGWTSPASSKASVHASMGLQPAGRYHRQGFSVTTARG